MGKRLVTEVDRRADSGNLRNQLLDKLHHAKNSGDVLRCYQIARELLQVCPSSRLEEVIAEI